MPDPESDPRPGPDSGPAPETPRGRLLAALRRPGRSQAVVAVLLAIAGFAGVVQIHANTEDSTYSTLRQPDLIALLQGLAGTTQRTQTEIDRLRRTRTQLESTTSRRAAALAEARKEAADLQVLAGRVPVTGPGIRVTVTETTGSVSVTSMLDAIEELRTVGAEAISLNGSVRVVAQTAIDEGVGGLSVDGVTLDSPYVIDAIGTPNTLAAALQFGLGPVHEFAQDGATTKIQQLPSLDITATASAARQSEVQSGTN